MNYTASVWAIVIFVFFVITVLAISYHFARLTKTSANYFAAGGSIHWAVNGIAFAGDYLSAASFLGICGMIAVAGYDGFLYSIGYLAGWIVALFVVAEPIKRLGKFTFTDALDAKFNSKGIQLAAGISTLLVSLFYLIPQMVGAGSLVIPLLGLPHEAGVIMVGTIVIIIVATAGMASTTYVQFIKGATLVIFSFVLVVLVLTRGVTNTPDQGGEVPFHKFTTIPILSLTDSSITLSGPIYKIVKDWKITNKGKISRFVKLENREGFSLWKVNAKAKTLEEALFVTQLEDGTKLYNGQIKDKNKFFQVGNMSVINGKDSGVHIENMNFFSFIETIKNSTVIRWGKQVLTEGRKTHTVYFQKPTSGAEVLSPGLKFNVDSDKGAKPKDKIDFISLMLALFLGTAALPHILIRYYTVPNAASARKSTIVAIAAIGLFYILTLYMGLGAMVNGVIDLTNDNMSAPLLARSFGVSIFALISALAFATVLGTVSGLIVAASGAVAHDLMDRFLDMKLTDKKKVAAGKMAAVVLGIGAMILGILFKGMNVSYLVGWAFAVAASANLPAIVMTLFWKKTTAKGVIASIVVGLFSALILILLSQETYNEVYHLTGVEAPVPFNNPAIVSVPLSFITLIVVTLFTQPKKETVKT